MIDDRPVQGRVVFSIHEALEPQTDSRVSYPSSEVLAPGIR